MEHSEQVAKAVLLLVLVKVVEFVLFGPSWREIKAVQLKRKQQARRVYNIKWAKEKSCSHHWWPEWKRRGWFMKFWKFRWTVTRFNLWNRNSWNVTSLRAFISLSSLSTSFLMKISGKPRVGWGPWDLERQLEKALYLGYNFLRLFSRRGRSRNGTFSIYIDSRHLGPSLSTFLQQRS